MSEKNDAPYVVKSPISGLMLDEILQNEEIIIEAVIVPFRPIKDAAASRLAVQTKSGDFFPNSVAGGITAGAGGVDQEQELHLRIERILLSLSRTHIPIIFVAYPMLMHDKEYLHRKLISIFPNIKYDKFSEAFDSIYVPQRVHEFGSEAVRNLQDQESQWNHNFVSQSIQQNVLSAEKINQLEAAKCRVAYRSSSSSSKSILTHHTTHYELWPLTCESLSGADEARPSAILNFREQQ